MRVSRPCIRTLLISDCMCVCVCVCSGPNSPPPSAFISACENGASVTVLRHCNRLHSSSLFRLSAHAWQFDCLSSPHRFSSHKYQHFESPTASPSPACTTPGFPCPPLPHTVFFIKDSLWVSESALRRVVGSSLWRTGGAAVVLLTFWCAGSSCLSRDTSLSLLVYSTGTRWESLFMVNIHVLWNAHL